MPFSDNDVRQAARKVASATGCGILAADKRCRGDSEVIRFVLDDANGLADVAKFLQGGGEAADAPTPSGDGDAPAPGGDAA